MPVHQIPQSVGVGGAWHTCRRPRARGSRQVVLCSPSPVKKLGTCEVAPNTPACLPRLHRFFFLHSRVSPAYLELSTQPTDCPPPPPTRDPDLPAPRRHRTDASRARRVATPAPAQPAQPARCGAHDAGHAQPRRCGARERERGGAGGAWRSDGGGVRGGPAGSGRAPAATAWALAAGRPPGGPALPVGRALQSQWRHPRAPGDDDDSGGWGTEVRAVGGWQVGTARSRVWRVRGGSHAAPSIVHPFPAIQMTSWGVCRGGSCSTVALRRRHPAIWVGRPAGGNPPPYRPTLPQAITDILAPPSYPHCRTSHPLRTSASAGVAPAI